jgi:hypothetical protein
LVVSRVTKQCIERKEVIQMDDFDDFDDDFGDDFDNGLENDVDNGSGQDSGDTCEGFWDLDTADFAIIGGVIGYLEEEIKERKRIEREMEKEQERIDDELTDCDCCTPPEEEPYP